MRTKNRLLGIDILRAIAVLAVLFAHALPPASTPQTIKDVLVVAKRGGFIGVDLFFVLSGFLVSSLLFTEYERYRSLRPGRFLIRRGLKIYPGFYVLLAVTIVYGIRGWWSVTLKGFLGEAFFLQNYLALVWGHTWSLAVEEHFYLLLTGALFLMASRARETDPSGKTVFHPLVPAFFFVAAFCLIGRALTYWAAYRSGRPLWMIATHLRIDELFSGVLLSYLWAFEGDLLRSFVTRHRRILTILVSISLPTFFVGWNAVVMATLGFVVLYLTFGALLLLILLRSIRPSIPALFFGRIGVASYSIYLWHFPWRIAVDHLIVRLHVPQSAWLVPLALYFFGSVVVGITAAALIELPVLRIRDRILPSRSSASAPVPPGIALSPDETDSRLSANEVASVDLAAI
ncbi:MAG: acyltransferase family protein [Gemmatimonadaceae bacterium]